MKTRLLLVGTLVLLLASAGSATVEPRITVESVSPQPAAPGDAVTMDIRLRNAGDEEATFDPLAVETPDGVAVTGMSGGFADGVTLCGGCQVVGTVYLKVAGDVVSGTYPVTLRLKRGNTGVAETAALEVDGTPALQVQAPVTSIVPGESTAVPVTVTNIGTDTATQVEVVFAGEGSAVSPSPLAVGSVPPGGNVTRTVTVQADDDLAAGLRDLALTVNYRDESDALSQDGTVTLQVLDSAELALADVAVDGAALGSRTTVTVKIENLGPGEAERIVADLACEGAAVLNGRAFVGQLDAGESVPMVFTVQPSGSDVSCTISTAFTDRERREISDTFGFHAEQQRSLVLPVVILLGILAAAGWYLRKRRQDELAAI